MTSNPTRPHNPQLTAAHALVQLLTLHPELSSVDWTVSDAGLTGRCSDSPDGTAESLADVLAGEVIPGVQPSLVSDRSSRVVFTVFQDVRLSVVVYSRPVVEVAA